MKTEAMNVLDDLDQIARSIRDCFDKYGPVEVAIIPIGQKKRKRTLPQNAALHKYCEIMAEKMNDAGISQKELVGKFRDGFELPVEMHMIKAIFREVGKAMYQKDSTAKLETVEMQKVYQVVDQRLGEVTGCRAEWPSMDSLIDESTRG